MPAMHRILLLILALLLPQAALAQSAPSVRLEITSREPAFKGQEFGAHGSYEMIKGIAHMRIDPRKAANGAIVDLDLAQRASDGMVEYDIDVTILRPRDAGKARRVLFYDVVNRGMRLLSMLTGSSANPDDPGDGLLMRQGYTLVWSGWQGDVAAKGLIGARFPSVTRRGKPVTGPVSTETIFDNLTANRITLPYPVASRDAAQLRLTVRALADSPQFAIPASDWSFVDDRTITLSRPAGMDAGAIYRTEYTARDPRVMGLGFAATRDFIAWLRHAPARAGNPLADIGNAPCEASATGACFNRAGGHFATAVAFGGSQSGRYLRDFLWQGFNRDLAGRKVFDGVIPFIPGARRTFTNFRFAEPGRFSRQHEDHDVPGFTFPYAYSTLTDAVTGKTDGILRACTATRSCPRVFHIDTGAEFWQAGASLVGTGGTGRDLAFPANVRAYAIASGSHSTGMTMPSCRYAGNPLNYSPIVRALLISMVDWTLGKTEPPASRWPSVAKAELIAAAAVRGPTVPSAGLAWPRVYNSPIPPAGKPAWPILVMQVDADGNELAGIRMPDVAAPTGTYLPWNPRKAGYAEGDLCLIAGAYLPFAPDAASRGGDTRQSMAERYPALSDRADRFRQATEALQRDGFLRDVDAAKLSGSVAN